MREIVLDTETTGLDPFAEPRHRIVEIGAIELWNQVPTDRTYHQYINPARPMPAEAFAVHGIGEDFLADKPEFAQIGQGFLDFIGDARLVIHNADFDMKFLNAELSWAGLSQIPRSQAHDTLAVARRRFPGAPASLDALCRRFGIDNSRREKHGALLDSEILAEVYMELSGGRQQGLGLGTGKTDDAAAEVGAGWRPGPRPKPLQPRLTEGERDAHAAFVEELGEIAVWTRYA